MRPERGSSIEGETEFPFVHALVCDVAYAQLTRADRAVKHAALARWLEERTAGRTEDLAEVLAYHYGTALELATSCGLDLEDELLEPTEPLPRLGRRSRGAARRVCRGRPLRPRRARHRRGARPRRWLLSRRTRRTVRRRAPLLVGAAAVIAVAAVARSRRLGLHALEDTEHGERQALRASEDDPLADCEEVRPQRRAHHRHGAGRGQQPGHLEARRELWVRRLKDGTIFTSYALFYQHWGDKYWAGKTYRQVEENYSPNWVKVEFVGAQGQYTAVRGFVIGWETGCGGLLIHVDPRQVHLVPIPLGDAEAARKGETVVALSRQQNEVSTAAGTLTRVIRGKNLITGEKVVGVLKTDATFPTGRDSSREPLPFLGGPMIDAGGRVVAVMGP